MASALTPDHLPGERLRLELIKEGRQARQAVGYLPDGDMVVVNDATHLIDQGSVEVTVLSTRPTSQGMMVFAKLAVGDHPDDDVAHDAPGNARPGALSHPVLTTPAPQPAPPVGRAYRADGHDRPVMRAVPACDPWNNVS